MPITDPYLGQRTTMRAFLDAVWPQGAAWQPEPGGDLDRFLDGIGDNEMFVHDALEKLARVRDPWTTPYLGELEREFGITPNVQLTEAQRRATLALVKYKRKRRATRDDLQEALDRAGFGEGGHGLQVYSNDPAINPAPYTDYAFITMAGVAESCCGYNIGGDVLAVCGVSGGLWVVNGDVFVATPNYLGCGDPTMLCGYIPAGGSEITACCGIYYSLSYQAIQIESPVDPSTWPLVFFVAKEGTDYSGWTVQTSMPSGNWQSIAWNGSLWCAVSNSGANLCATSPDGITWTAQAGMPSGNWQSIAWNGSLWCAVASVGGANSCATSPDGITWTARSIPSGYWWSVAWNGSLFCAVAYQQCVTSPDGITWTARSIPSGTWRSVAWNGSLFCAVGSGGWECATSPDGITWTARSIPSGYWWSVAWNGSLFCAVAYQQCVTSPDGITWTARSIPSGTWRSVAWNGSFWCAVGNNVCAISPNGIGWTVLRIPSGYWLSIVWNGNLFCAVSNSNPNLCATWGIPALAIAQIPGNQRSLLCEIILRWKPLGTWCALLCTFS